MKNTRNTILTLLQKKPQIKLEDVSDALNISKQYVSRVIKQLIQTGQVEKIGTTKGAYFILTDFQGLSMLAPKEYSYNKEYNLKGLAEDVVLHEIFQNTKILHKVSTEVKNKFSYIFSEILNNAIDHSEGKKVRVIIIRDKNRKISCWIIDNGIGIFKKISKQLKLKNGLEAIQELLKGKVTTDAKNHTGEGIFFSSRIADRFIIDGNDKRLFIKKGDSAVSTISRFSGTRIKFNIDFKSSITIQGVFKNFTENFKFTKTEIIVKLYEIKTEFISRSEAKRLLINLNKFKHVTLDFKHVTIIGQGFADEIFRVWHKRYPAIQLQYKNAIEDVEFMIKRAQV